MILLTFLYFSHCQIILLFKINHLFFLIAGDLNRQGKRQITNKIVDTYLTCSKSGFMTEMAKCRYNLSIMDLVCKFKRVRSCNYSLKCPRNGDGVTYTCKIFVHVYTDKFCCDLKCNR